MAVIKNPTELDNSVNYVATLALFCCISCVVAMLKFRGFRASMNLSSWRKKDNEIEPVTLTGAYRNINRDELYSNGGVIEPPKKFTPSMVKLPPSSQPETSLRPTKSTSDLVRQNNLPPQLARSSYDISVDPRGRPTTNREEESAPTRPNRKERNKKQIQDKEQKKLEKQRLAEQKAREKAEAQEQARKDKIRREAEKKAAQEQAKAKKAYRKKAPPIPQAPVPPPPPTTPHALMANPLAMNPAPSYSAPNPVAMNQAPYLTNTLESSISRTSGPPPYAEVAESDRSNTASGNSNSGNVSFSKPIDNPSWDLISQHRQQISRPTTSAVQKGARKNMVLDLQYKLGNDNKDDAEA